MKKKNYSNKVLLPRGKYEKEAWPFILEKKMLLRKRKSESYTEYIRGGISTAELGFVSSEIIESFEIVESSYMMDFTCGLRRQWHGARFTIRPSALKKVFSIQRLWKRIEDFPHKWVIRVVDEKEAPFSDMVPHEAQHIDSYTVYEYMLGCAQTAEDLNADLQGDSILSLYNKGVYPWILVLLCIDIKKLST